MPHVTVERWEAVRDAVDLHRRGLDFADAVHWACSRGGERFVTFEERCLARRARRLRLAPEIVLVRQLNKHWQTNLCFDAGWSEGGPNAAYFPVQEAF